MSRIEGYLRIEDHGLIGDGATAALVGRDGAVSWLCVPRFHAPPLFCGLLDRERGGRFLVAPAEALESRQYYVEDCPVLVTEIRTATGLVQIRDLLPLRSGADLTEGTQAGRQELLRSVSVLHGRVELSIEFAPRYGAEAQPHGGALEIRWVQDRGLPLWLLSSRPLSGLRTTVGLKAGERMDLLLRWAPGGRRRLPFDAEDLIASTVGIWKAWMARMVYSGPQTALVRRSAMVLKLLDYFESGAIVAAPTSSLPECIGGTRNWDYRYAWIRDAAFSVYALRRVGLAQEAEGFLGWVLDAIDREGRPRVLYDLDGQAPPSEREDDELEGYRRTHPVRWGNAAYEQRQHDVYGEILDCAYQWSRQGGQIDDRLWARLRRLVEAAGREWATPDHGIWEVRTTGRPFTYSAALCHVALDRGARLADKLGLPGDGGAWRAAADDIARQILERAWSPALRSLTQHLDGEVLDASLLALPLRRVIPADHPRMVATTEAVARHLDAGGGLLYRYLPDEAPDGLPGHEGAFLLCSFWLVDNLAKQGRLRQAMDLYDGLCGRASPLGLLSEQIDPSTGAFLGNFPQGFSHIGVISSGILLGRILGREAATGS